MATGGGMREPRARDLACLLLLAAAAFALRSPLLDDAPYGDESGHYMMARTLGVFGDDLPVVGTGATLELSRLVVARPVFALAFAPFAWLGFAGFRFAGVAAAALVAPALFAAVRSWGGQRAVAAVAGGVYALHPYLVAWQSKVFPDSLMALLFLLGLARLGRGRVAEAAGLLLLACWAKESAVPAVLGLAAACLAPAAWRRFRGGADRLLDRTTLLLLGAAGAGTLATATSVLAGGTPPGWGRGGSLPAALETLLLSSWLLLPLVGGLLARASRPWCSAALATLGAYAAHMLVRGGAVEGWYVPLPAALALGGAGLAACHLLRRRHRQPRAARAATAAMAALAALLLVPVLGTAGAAAWIVHPADPRDDPGLLATWASGSPEGRDLEAAARFHRGVAPARVLQVDVLWFYALHPFGGSHATTVAFTVGPWATGDAGRVAQAAERADVTWMHLWGTPLEEALAETYRDCLLFEQGPWRAYGAAACPGRGALLAHRLAARLEASAHGAEGDPA
jgi:hypothetical protein